MDQNGTHPVYGKYALDKPLKLYGHQLGKLEVELLDKYEIVFLPSKIKPFIIKRVSTQHEMTEIHGCIHINQIHKTQKAYSVTHLILASAFPDITPDEGVDHINGDLTDNRVENLQWMSRSENARKGQITNANDGRQGRYINMLRPNETNPKEPADGHIFATFRSVEKTAKYLIDNVSYKNKPTVKSVASKITRSLKIPHYKVYGYFFKDATNWNMYDNETWTDHNKYKVSSKARVKGKCGTILTPVLCRKYSSLSIDGTLIYVHRLVWLAFHGEIPEGLEILHDDSAPLLENGCYRNHLVDLRLGTRSQNMTEFHSSDLSLRPTFSTPLEKLLIHLPTYIQYVKPTSTRGSKYVINRNITPEGQKDVCSSGSKALSDKQKFISILPKYCEFMNKDLVDFDVSDI
jgi:hypothetical protein